MLSKEDLDRLGGFARYKDVDGDGVGYRTLPGTDHPQAAWFARGSGHNEKAQVQRASRRLTRTTWTGCDRKFETARSFVPKPEMVRNEGKRRSASSPTAHRTGR